MLLSKLITKVLPKDMKIWFVNKEIAKKPIIVQYIAKVFMNDSKKVKTFDKKIKS